MPVDLAPSVRDLELLVYMYRTLRELLADVCRLVARVPRLESSGV